MEQKTLQDESIQTTSTLGRSLSAGYWSLLDTVMQKVLIYGAFFITARMLTPNDYGIIALSLIYPNLLDSLTAIAFDNAVLQKKAGEERPYLNVVWTFNMFRSFIVFAITFCSSFVFAKFFNTPDTLLLFQLSALPILIQSFANIGQVYFFRKLEFKKVFIRDMASYGTTAVTTMYFAFTLHSYWALFIGSVMGMSAAVIATYILGEFRPKIDIGFRKLKPLLEYSQWVFGQGAVSRLAQTTEDAVVGHLTTPTSVGNYSKAKSLAYAPTSPLANIISKIGFSALVATGGSLPHIREGFYKSFDLAITIAIPFAVVIWLCGTELVHLLLGEAWAGITPLLKTLVIVSALNTSIQSITGMVLNAMGKPKRQFQLSALSLASTIVFLPTLVVSYGISGAALSLLVTAVIVNGYALYLIGVTIAPLWKRVIETSIATFASAIIPLIIITPLLNSSFVVNKIFYLFATLLYGCIYMITLVAIGKLSNKGPLATLMVIAKNLPKKTT